MKTYAFIDASNLFYGGEKSLGWKIDYEKLLKYLTKNMMSASFFISAGSRYTILSMITKIMKPYR